jgi:hypothetical protein
MRVPLPLVDGFRTSIEDALVKFALKNGSIPDNLSLSSTRFIQRSIVPHVQKLSETFNRITDSAVSQSSNVQMHKYWEQSSNPKNLSFSYFLGFAIPNAFRIAAIICELERLGFNFSSWRELKFQEIGAGPCTGALALAAARSWGGCQLPSKGSLLSSERQKFVLSLGAKWVEYIQSAEPTEQGPDLEFPWTHQTLHETFDLHSPQQKLRANNFILLSYFMNELGGETGTAADTLLKLLPNLTPGGILVIVEPALKEYSRRLLEVRKHLLSNTSFHESYEVLTPCIGSQNCGALENIEDWCHESVSWWRPKYLQLIDKIVELDHRSLAFSYLVIHKKNGEYPLTQTKKHPSEKTYRLVSGSRKLGTRDLEFFVCGQDGKHRSRFRSKGKKELIENKQQLERGQLIEINWDEHSEKSHRDLATFTSIIK